MNWLANLLRPAAKDPLSALRAEPTPDQRAEYRAEWQEQDKLDALKQGTHTISGLTNVAFGTRGWSLHALRMEGLMECECLPGMPGEGGRYRYMLTAAGRRRAAELL